MVAPCMLLPFHPDPLFFFRYICEDDHTPDMAAFVQAEGLQYYHYALEGNKEPFGEMDPVQIGDALGKILGKAFIPPLPLSLSPWGRKMLCATHLLNIHARSPY